MFAIIYPVCALPLLTVLFIVHRRAKKSGQLESYKSSFDLMGGRQLAVALFWHLDVIGIILMIAIFACILVPFTLAGGVKTTWGTAKVIAPLVIGVLLIPVWIFWEKKCKYPMLPFKVCDMLWVFLFAGTDFNSTSKTAVYGLPLELLLCLTQVCMT